MGSISKVMVQATMGMNRSYTLKKNYLQQKGLGVAQVIEQLASTKTLSSNSSFIKVNLKSLINGPVWRNVSHDMWYPAGILD
jgi:hypothetical protein